MVLRPQGKLLHNIFDSFRSSNCIRRLAKSIELQFKEKLPFEIDSSSNLYCTDRRKWITLDRERKGLVVTLLWLVRSNNLLTPQHQLVCSVCPPGHSRSAATHRFPAFQRTPKKSPNETCGVFCASLVLCLNKRLSGRWMCMEREDRWVPQE